MTDFLLNDCGDLDFTEGKLTLLTGVDLIRQRWLIHVRTFLGEYFLDESIGVPWFQRVLKKAQKRDKKKSSSAMTAKKTIAMECFSGRPMERCSLPFALRRAKGKMFT